MEYFKDFRITKDEVLKGDRFYELSKHYNDLCYIWTHFWHFSRQIIFRGEVHPTHIKPYVISGHSDYSITKEIFEKYQHLIKVWFSVNVEYDNEKLIPIPIGLTNLIPEDTSDSFPHRILGNMDLLMEVVNMPKKDDRLVYMNFSIGTFPTERKLVYDMFCKKSYVDIGESILSYEGRKKFLKEIKDHKFCLCPRGNGIDTCRLWESLYMGTIPIVIYNITHKNLLDLPILFINDWTDITEDFLNKKYEEIHSKKWNMEKIKFSYWKNLIYNTCNLTEDMLNKKENYLLFEYFDYDGEDIAKVEPTSIENIRKKCNDLGGYAFTTFGNIKGKIDINKLKRNNSYTKSEGIYINIEKYYAA
jgi:hypothetical protein